MTDRYVDVVDEGYDAVIRLEPLKDAGLAAREFAANRQVACAAPAYLAAHECLGFVNRSGLLCAERRFTKDERVHAVRVRSRFRANDGRVLLAPALEGHGVILRPEVVVPDELDAGRLVQVLPAYAAPSRLMYPLFSERRPQTPKLRAFIEGVVEASGRSDG